MTFQPTKLAGVVDIRLERKYDERGFFARSWCRTEFESEGLNAALVQCSISFNRRKGTLRGMHYQAEPHGEVKLVRCTSGSVYDVVLDLRTNSSTFLRWMSVILSAAEGNMIYIPEGCAHGFLTLEDDTEVFYQMSEFYYPEAARGVRWNDSTFKIEWPGEVAIISERDRTYPDFRSIDAVA